MKFTMQGVYTALITPFTPSGDICQKTLSHLLQMQHDANIDCVVVLGTTGEPATIDDQERDMIIKSTVQQLKGKVPIMVGCGSPCTKKSVDMAKRAQDLGADAIQVISPYVNKPEQEGLFLHFEAISKAIDLPLCIYNHPGRCAVNINIATLEKLSALPNVVGIKECSGSFQLLTDVVEKICSKHPSVSLFCGDDPMTVAMMTMGASGVMSVLSNLMPKTIKQLVRYMSEGRLKEAQKLHYSLKPIFDVLFVESNPIGIKYLMQLAGLTGGHLRLPLTVASTQAQAKLTAGYNACRTLIENELPTEVLA